MRKFLPFLAFLMLALTGVSGMAHAADLSGGKVAGVEFTIHIDGQNNQAPSDGDQSFPHHHNYCHGHDLGTTAQTNPGQTLASSGAPPVMTAVASLKACDGHVHLKPPQA